MHAALLLEFDLETPLRPVSKFLPSGRNFADGKMTPKGPAAAAPPIQGGANRLARPCTGL